MKWSRLETASLTGRPLLRGAFDDDDAVVENDDEDLAVRGQRDAVLGEMTRSRP